MLNFIDCWMEVASTLFAQTLAGQPELAESSSRPLESGSFGFATTLDGDIRGRFCVTVDAAVLESPFLGEGRDQKEAWCELLREVSDAAAGEFLARTGKNCRVTEFEAAEAEGEISRVFQLRSADHTWKIVVRDEVREAGFPVGPAAPEPKSARSSPRPAPSPGIELMLDVELEATLRFGCREMPLGEILELGPGDVVQLDRHVSDPVDLIVGDKIVARGEVVLVNGNFGLRVSEVATPRKRLETIRCLF